MFPPRTKADLGIRLSRPADLPLFARTPRERSAVMHDILSLKGDWDYIAAFNVIRWNQLTRSSGSRQARRLQALGAFSGGSAHFEDFAKALSNTIKSKPCSIDDDLRLYVELSCLLGYRNLPFPGFDIEAEARKLANGGNPHPFPPGMSFEKQAARYLSAQGKPVPYMSLHEFVTTPELWLTAGASSEGTFTFSLDGEAHSIRARKNMLPDSVDLSALAARVEMNAQQTHKTLVKSESGKVRLAVAGDLLSYLQMAWISYLAGHAYEKWDGSTVGESTVEESDRLCDMIQRCDRQYSIPFDYSSFDHQAQTDELKVIARILCGHASHNVPSLAQASFQAVCERVVASFDNARLLWRDGDRSGEFPFTGGLASGLGWTSTMGNAWNTVMTATVRDILADEGCDVSGWFAYIRGDDSAIFLDSPVTARVVVATYLRLGILTAPGKYGLWRGQTEFLRVWIRHGRCEAYPVRAFITMQQRKPWSSSPWDEYATLVSLWGSVKTMSRRGIDALKLWHATAPSHAQRVGLPMWVVSAPVALGGLGLGPWDGTRPDQPIPRVDRGVDVIISQQRADMVDREFAESGFQLSDREQVDVARRRVGQVVGADDIPAAAAGYRARLRRAIRAYRPTRLRTQGEPFVGSLRIAAQPGSHASFRDNKTSLGSLAALARQVNACRDVALLRGVSLRSMLRKYMPDLSRMMSGSRHMSDVLDWFVFGITVGSMLHDSLSSDVAQLCARACGGLPFRDRARTISMNWNARDADAILGSTELVRRVWHR